MWWNALEPAPEYLGLDIYENEILRPEEEVVEDETSGTTESDTDEEESAAEPTSPNPVEEFQLAALAESIIIRTPEMTTMITERVEVEEAPPPIMRSNPINPQTGH